MPTLQSLALKLMNTFRCRCLHLGQWLLTHLAYQLSHCQWPWLKNRLIVFFLSHWTPNLKEAQETNPFAYRSFNAFFTRALNPHARILQTEPSALLAPADGQLTQFHTIESGQLIQAKGHTYTVEALLGSTERAQAFQTGITSTIYLAPTDYHCVHMPLAGTLKSMTHIPGMFYSVNTDSAAEQPDLFAKNERLICHFDTPYGDLVLVMVGALLVSSIETTWHGLIRARGFGAIQHFTYEASQAPSFKQGDRMGWFHFGSTVITLFNPQQPVELNALNLPSTVQYGSVLTQIQSGQS
ncbi:MAG: phosphatidylserine decarboxylase [Legionellales bacterium]|nr:phosphatidylserine decarboxylase [Legionellales bacterium]